MTRPVRSRIARAAVTVATLLALAGCATVAPPGDSPSSEEPRVVSLSDEVFDLAALGIAPVGNFYGPQYLEPVLPLLDLDPAVQEAVLTAPNVAPGFAVDVEAVAAARPTVILVSAELEPLIGAVRADLERIAPVMVLPAGGTWQDGSRAVAAAVGRPGAADPIIEDTERRLVALDEQVATSGAAGHTVSLLRYLGDQVFAFVPPSLPSNLVAQIGLAQPAAQLGAAANPEFPPSAAQVDISQEVLLSHDADLVLFGYAEPGDTERFRAGPVASRLGGEVVGVPYVLWSVDSAVGVRQIVTDLETHLARIPT